MVRYAKLCPCGNFPTTNITLLKATCRAKCDGAYQLKVEPHEDILTVLAGLSNLVTELEECNLEANKGKALSYVL